MCIKRANEVVVEAFLNDKVGFLSMSDVIENCMEKITFVKNPSLEDYIKTDIETRILARNYYKWKYFQKHFNLFLVYQF